jgi:hypothetical protein
MYHKLLILIITSIILSGCTSAFEMICREEPREQLSLLDPDTPNLESIKWHVLTRKNVEQKFDALKELGYDEAFIGLTDEGYEDLSINSKKTQNFIIKQRKITDEYRRYYEPKAGETKE